MPAEPSQTPPASPYPTRRAAVRQADVTRVAKGMENAGWARGSFKIVVEGGAITVLPIEALEDAADLERRMEEAFANDRRAPAVRH